MCDLSIIVPVYNTEEYLSNCVDSILDSSYSDFELILIDDGSSDSCGQVCNQYQMYDRRVRVIHQNNAGVSEARNAGLKIACGKYIAFIDSDDMIDKYMLSKMVSALKDGSADIVCCGMMVLGSNIPYLKAPNHREEYYGSESQILLLKKDGVGDYLMNKLYRRELFEGIWFPVGMIFEDTFVQYKVFEKAKKVINLNECLYLYRINQTGISHSKILRPDIMCFQEACYEQYKYIRESIPTLSEIAYAKYSNSLIVIAKSFVKTEHSKRSRKLVNELSLKARISNEQISSNRFVSQERAYELKKLGRGYFCWKNYLIRKYLVDCLHNHKMMQSLIRLFLRIPSFPVAESYQY